MFDSSLVVQALEALSKKDISEIRSFTRPPPKVEMVMEAVMILKNSEPSWAESKRQLADVNFLATVTIPFTLKFHGVSRPTFECPASRLRQGQHLRQDAQSHFQVHVEPWIRAGKGWPGVCGGQVALHVGHRHGKIREALQVTMEINLSRMGRRIWKIELSPSLFSIRSHL